METVLLTLSDMMQANKRSMHYLHPSTRTGYFRSALKDCIEADMEWDLLPDADLDTFGQAPVWIYPGKLLSNNDISGQTLVWFHEGKLPSNTSISGQALAWIYPGRLTPTAATATCAVSDSESSEVHHILPQKQMQLEL
ncbi:uncharacterized protein K452DRAFT_303483 [Aplosporella prunicola CBS 121167]|uniref:Uncharacterized protein n=1 Tax=Aplosporella prunicola CBS 121167 TaxID=1176127 RepID=A0A6A6AV48_9PEZI|nr:uncharacterized protein K452DRAFT_303483 [Aplosporella prunicola CBS 121167]KAF2135540.1 hypothetical protein K452DRAFT_303483 [Aplosporella prunicola CBS 121167]